jgi:O-antigen ligase
MLLPFMVFRDGRAELDHNAGVAMANGNDLALWFGFCALALTIEGFETPRGFRRWISWTAAILSAVVLALTVSRGPLIALAVCIIIVLRKQLKRGFLQIFLVAALAVAAMASGVLDGAIQRYGQRTTEESGRFVIWPRVLARMWESPAAGVGLSRILTPLDNRRMIPPHNGFLFIGLASGAVPLFFFCLYWLIGLRGALKGSSPQNPDSAYLLPLWVYAFMSLFEGDGTFMTTWSIISVCACLPHSGFRHRHESRSGSKRQLKDGEEFEFVVSRL